MKRKNDYFAGWKSNALNCVAVDHDDDGGGGDGGDDGGDDDGGDDGGGDDGGGDDPHSDY